MKRSPAMTQDELRAALFICGFKRGILDDFMLISKEHVCITVQFSFANDVIVHDHLEYVVNGPTESSDKTFRCSCEHALNYIKEKLT